MGESTLIPLAVGILIGVAVTAAVVLVLRFVRGSRDLGDEGEHATYRTLHLASKAAHHLRGGLADEDAVRAARDLRALLRCDVLALVDLIGAVALDGPGDHLRELSAHLVRETTDRIRVLPVDGDPLVSQAIVAPILVDGVVVGAVIAFSSTGRAPLIRATTEVAAWVSAQIRLGELDASRTALAQAELRALRAQISPHFIYNALNAIASFINTNPVRARELVLEFADFTRYSFRRHGEFTTLAEELRSIHSYLLLERARFGPRLQVVLQIAPETLSTVIPFLSIQPLVENAVRHGLESKEGGGTITITSADVGTDVQICVEDDGAGIDPDELEALLAGRASTDHIGLLNVDTRLRQVYGDAHGLVVETNVGSGTLVRVVVPRSQSVREPMSERDAGKRYPAERS